VVKPAPGPAWDGRRLGQVGELLHRGPQRRRPPGQVEEDEVVGEVQFVSGIDVFHQAAQVQQVDLADEHPVVVLLDDGPLPSCAWPETESPCATERVRMVRRGR
jgi:hypothetical protein